MSTFDNRPPYYNDPAPMESKAEPKQSLGARLNGFLEGRNPKGSPRVERPGRPPSSIRFDWIAAALSSVVVGGVFLDGWAHNHGKVDQTFFTPWHAILYAGFACYAIFLLVQAVRNYRAGYAWRSALPFGYGLSLIGAGIFAGGGVLDLIWHTLFGIEVDVQALLSPTHLLLATGLFLMIIGPLRSGWQQYRGTRALQWLTGAPVLIVLTLLLSLLMFFTQFAHPLVRPWAANNPGMREVHGDLYIMRADGNGQARLTKTQPDAGAPSWAPDGRHIAFDAGQQGSRAIYVIQNNGAGLKRLTARATDSYQPAWSPSGAHIAFASMINGTSQIMVMNANGSKPRQLTSGSANAFGPAWSPDSKRIIFESNRSGDFNLYTISADGKGQPVRLTQTSGADDFQAAWAPDGKRIAFVSTRSGSAQIYLMNANGSGQQSLTTATGADTVNYSPVWLPSGGRIAFVTTRDGNGEIYEMNPDGSHLVNLSNNAGLDDGTGLLSVTRDGRAFAYGAVGHPAIDAEMSTALGIASILLQTALMLAILLFMVRRWTLPLGTATLLFTVSAILISFMNDQFRFIPVAILAGIVADALLFVLRPTPERRLQLRIFAFAVPVVYFLFYFVALALTGGVAWIIHLWFGAPIMAGIAGLFLSYLAVPPSLDTSSAPIHTQGY